MIDFLLRADDREALEAFAKGEGFMGEDGMPAREAVFDPMPDSAAWVTGIPITPLPVEVLRLPAGPDKFPPMESVEVTTPPELVPPPGIYVNLRIWGSLEEAQVEGLTQTRDATEEEAAARDGMPGFTTVMLPLRQRTRLGQEMTTVGTEGVQGNGTTTFVTVAGVSFIDPESVATRQRVWQ